VHATNAGRSVEGRGKTCTHGMERILLIPSHFRRCQLRSSIRSRLHSTGPVAPSQACHLQLCEGSSSDPVRRQFSSRDLLIAWLARARHVQRCRGLDLEGGALCLRKRASTSDAGEPTWTLKLFRAIINNPIVCTCKLSPVDKVDGQRTTFF
jgi:hypothetical protein